MIAAPSSRQGKTLITAALAHAIAQNHRVTTAKSGPDYIDPAFHAAATGSPCLTLDPWAMAPARLRACAAELVADAEYSLIESAMGLFDGPPGARGSSFDLASALDLPIILVIDATAQGQSLGALIHGFLHWRRHVDDPPRFAGMIFNRVASARHEKMLRSALDADSPPLLGCLPYDSRLVIPHRHLGLVQVSELSEYNTLISSAAALIRAHIDLDRVKALMQTPSPPKPEDDRMPSIAPPGQCVAIADDAAFSFIYPHLLADWRRHGCQIRRFSPLRDETPDCSADAIFLPGGYPELHAAKLAQASRFHQAMHKAARHGVRIYGECGGFMALGESLRDVQGTNHAMLGLLPITTAMGTQRAQLGYRLALPIRISDAPPPWPGPVRAHEFHYATAQQHGRAQPLFRLYDAAGHALGDSGLQCGTVCGSFIHMIDAAADLTP